MAYKHPAHTEPRQPRPWLTRRSGECAFPQDGEGLTTRSCCRPCADASPYCESHRGLMKGPRAPAVADLLREYARFLA